MALNVTTLVLFAINAVMIRGTWDTAAVNLAGPLWLTGIGCLVLLGAGYLGWTMVSRDKVGVDLSPEQERLQENQEHKEEPLFH
jgi:hypothetical protein